jgi:hypothetical protein
VYKQYSHRRLIIWGCAAASLLIFASFCVQLKSAIANRHRANRLSQLGAIVTYACDVDATGAPLDCESWSTKVLRRFDAKALFYPIIEVSFIRPSCGRLAEAEILSSLEGLSSIKSLDLQATRTSDASVNRIANLAHLHTLNLANTDVTDEGLPALTRLGELKVLYLDGCRVSDYGMLYIAQLPSIEHLDVTSTLISDTGLLNLSSARNLASVRAKGTRVTPAGVAALLLKNPAVQTE